MYQGLCLFDEQNHILFCNSRFCELYEIPPALTARGAAFTGLQDFFRRDDCFGADFELLAAIPRGPDIETTAKHKDGRSFAIRARSTGRDGWVSTHAEITRRVVDAEKIRYMATHDELTALPNRAYFIEKITSTAELGASVVLLRLSLNRYKATTDTIGHKMGDALLRAMSERLGHVCPPNAILARLGDDEFGAFCRLNDVEDALHLGQRLLDELRRNYEIRGQSLQIMLSIGIAYSPNYHRSETLFKEAGLARRAARSEEISCFRLYNSTMMKRVHDRLQLEKDLHVGLSCDQFEIRYQPILSARRRHVVAFEALVRWRHPVRGFLPPSEFIPLAEELGIIVPLGDWIIRQACLDASRWPADIRLAVNISAVQFRSPDLFRSVLESLEIAGLHPNRLEVEITETALLQDSETTWGLLQKFYDKGIHLALDDFGTGYSSLSHLRRLPFHSIKIDRGFVADIAECADARTIVTAVTQLASTLGISTTAEGVETVEQLTFLRGAGCRDVQGFLFSDARPASEIPDLLQKFAPSADVREEFPLVEA
jgi:diguanylate cyclase (GGDEF)-like protein